MRSNLGIISALLVANVIAWPGMKHRKIEGEDYIGPACTVGMFGLK